MSSVVGLRNRAQKDEDDGGLTVLPRRPADVVEAGVALVSDLGPGEGEGEGEGVGGLVLVLVADPLAGAGPDRFAIADEPAVDAYERGRALEPERGEPERVGRRVVQVLDGIHERLEPLAGDVDPVVPDRTARATGLGCGE